MKILYGAKMVFTRSAIAYNSAERQCLFYSPVVWGGGRIRHWGSYFWRSGGCAPSGIQGKSPWSGGLGRSPPEAESFSLHKYLTFAPYEAFVQNLVPVNLAVSNVRCKNLLGSLGEYNRRLGNIPPTDVQNKNWPKGNRNRIFGGTVTTDFL